MVKIKMKIKNYIAIDLGAESGRVVIGTFDGSRVKLQEVHRFKTGASEFSGALCWDVPGFLAEIKRGLKLCSQYSNEFDGIGIDTWGVDYGLLDKSGNLIENPVHYRDRRTDGIMEKVFKKVPREEIYRETGIQFMQINTLYQLYSVLLDRPETLKQADCLLMMPSLFNYFLCGEKLNEYTMATTSQCYSAVKDAWAESILGKLGLPAGIFAPAVKPGTVIGRLLPELSSETGLADIPVIAVGSHDTASAVAAVPAKKGEWAFVSSGTWSLVGCELREPAINAKTLEYDLTNEGGVEGTVRLLKNVMGLWIVQECRREWAKAGEELSYQEIAELAERAEPFRSFIDVNDGSFLKAGNMPENVRRWCAAGGQPVPEDKGGIVRCVLESLAFKYREVIEQLEEIRNKPIDTVHVVGGGANNKLLCKFTADATGCETVTGPVEATAAGNVMIQCIARKEFPSLSRARELLSDSVNLTTYGPEESEDWDYAYKRYLNILSKKSGSHPE
jgi:rhamnulokinase